MSRTLAFRRRVARAAQVAVVVGWGIPAIFFGLLPWAVEDGWIDAWLTGRIGHGVAFSGLRMPAGRRFECAYAVWAWPAEGVAQVSAEDVTVILDGPFPFGRVRRVEARRVEVGLADGNAGAGERRWPEDVDLAVGEIELRLPRVTIPGEEPQGLTVRARAAGPDRWRADPVEIAWLGGRVRFVEGLLDSRAETAEARAVADGVSLEELGVGDVDLHGTFERVRITWEGLSADGGGWKGEASGGRLFLDRVGVLWGEAARFEGRFEEIDLAPALGPFVETLGHWAGVAEGSYRVEVGMDSELRELELYVKSKPGAASRWMDPKAFLRMVSLSGFEDPLGVERVLSALAGLAEVTYDHMGMYLALDREGYVTLRGLSYLKGGRWGEYTIEELRAGRVESGAVEFLVVARANPLTNVIVPRPGEKVPWERFLERWRAGR